MKKENSELSGFVIFAITAIMLIFVLTVCQTGEKRDRVSEPSIPDGYHIFYDDENKMIIAPKEYHFRCDESGKLILTRQNLTGEGHGQ